MKRPRVVAIVPAAGSGKRLGARTKKPFVMLGGKPLVAHALETLDSCKAINAIVVAAENSCVDRIREIACRYRIGKLIDVVAGGKERYDSVRNCLDAIGPLFDIVLIHDAARPLVDRSTVERSIKAAGKFGACVVCAPITDTVKLAEDGLFVKKTLDRGRLYRAETPQVFRYEIIRKAYAALTPRRGEKFTDDASLVEAQGGKVRILEGTGINIKITTKEDIRVAEALLSSSE